MSEPALWHEEIEQPNYDGLITEDGKPVESVFHDRQMRLLVDVLYTSWQPGRSFVALADVGLFGSDDEKAVVPDVIVSLGARIPRGKPLDKKNRSYYTWRYGKSPDIVVEVVSNSEGGEDNKKLRYAELGVSYLVHYDPEGYLSDVPLRSWELHGRHYVDLIPNWLPDSGLGVALWEGEFEGMQAVWMRWCDRDGLLLPAGFEAVASERGRADAERARAERLEAQLRFLGIEPDA